MKGHDKLIYYWIGIASAIVGLWVAVYGTIVGIERANPTVAIAFGVVAIAFLKAAEIYGK